jgi:hypothetical protein
MLAMPSSRLLLITASLALLLTGSAARACNVPVFRFALESRRWLPDAFELTVFHRGPFNTDQLRWLDAMRQRCRREGGFLNLDVETIDVTGPVPEESRKLWKAHESERLPCVVLRFPEADEETPAAWSGPLDERTADLLGDSPMRREIIRRLLSGDSVVWLLLESGDRDADEKARQLLAQRLPALEREIQLPTLQDDDRRHLQSKVPLRIAFPGIRLSRTDPAEAFLIRVLLASHPGVEKQTGPLVFPLFGRGRVAAPLYGKHLTAEDVEETAIYLCGPCSCEVKRDNPGSDLPFAVDWDSALGSGGPGKELLGGELPSVPALTPAPGEDRRTAPAPAGEDALARSLFWTALGLLGTVVLGAVLLALRGKRTEV